MKFTAVKRDMSDTLGRYLDIESEDDLTRIVFGMLELLGPSVIAEVLELPSDAFSDDVRVEFHTRLDPRANRIPDVVIEDSEMTVMIEAKRGTDFDLNQLQDEHDDLHQFGNEQKRLLLVTGHESRPARLDQSDLDFAEWLGWRDIALRISRYDRADLSETQRRLIDLLQTKLKDEGYVPFAGFSDRLLRELPAIWNLSERYHGHIARFHRDVEGRLGDRGLQAKNMWRDGISQDFNRFPGEIQFFSTHLWIAYGTPDAAVNNKTQHYLFVAFCIEDGETPIVRVGYSVSPKQNPSIREALINNADEIVQFVAKYDARLLHADRNFRVIERFDEKTEMTSLLNAESTLSSLDRMQIAVEYGSERLTDPNLAESVADDLVAIHEFADPRLYP